MEELGYDAITTVEEIKPPLRTSRDLEMYQMFGNPTKRKNTPSHSPKKEKADSHDDQIDRRKTRMVGIGKRKKESRQRKKEKGGIRQPDIAQNVVRN